MVLIVVRVSSTVRVYSIIPCIFCAWIYRRIFIVTVTFIRGKPIFISVTFSIWQTDGSFCTSIVFTIDQSIKVINAAFAGVFLIESVLRYLCFGLYGFRRDLWNVVDLVIVIISIVTTTADFAGQSIGSFSVLRTVRVFRPLRSVSALPSVQTLVVSMIRAVRSLVDVALVYLLFVVCFGIVGVVQFEGELRTRCVREEFWADFQNDSSPLHGALVAANYSLPDFVCGGSFETSAGFEPSIGCALMQTCDVNSTGRLLRGYQCPFGYRCHRVENPFYGMISFDSLPQAVLTLFVCVTEETWFVIAYMLMDSFDVTAAYYFIVVLVIGSFFIINVSIVLITITFEASSAFQAQKASKLISMSRLRRGSVNSSAFQRLSDSARRSRLHSLMTINGRAVGQQPTDTGRVLDDKSSDAKSVDADARAADVPTRPAVRRRRAGAELLVDDDVDLMLDAPHLASDGDDDTTDTDGRSRAATASSTVVGERPDAWDDLTNRVAAVRTFRQTLRYFFENDYIAHGVNGLIILNIVAMCVQYYGMPPLMEQILHVTNIVFTAVFAAEFVVRFIYFGPKRYFSKPINLLDFFVVVLSLIDVSAWGADFPSVKALRCVRLLKVLKSFPGVLRWAVVVVVCMKASFLLMITIAFFNFVFSCFGMQLFGGKFCNMADSSDARPDNVYADAGCPNRPRANFDSIGVAMLTSFQIMTGDNWDAVMYNGMRATNPLASVVFVTYFCISSYVLTNILVGILLSGPSPDEVNRMGQQLFEANVDDSASSSNDASQPPAWLGDDVDQAHAIAARLALGQTPIRELSCRERLRQFLQQPATEMTMLFLIVSVSIASAFVDPLAAPDTPRMVVLKWVDIIATGVFVAEIAVNIFAFGFVRGKESYLRRDTFNSLDFAVVFVSVLGVIGQYGVGNRSLRIAVSIRAIRPLRFVKRAKGLRVVFMAFVRSIVPLRNLFILALMVWTCWGLMGVQLFSGRFYRCSNAAILDVGNCTAAGERWMNSKLHFDHLGAAFLSLFNIASLEQWSLQMHDGMDAVGQGLAPQVNHQPVAALYFVSFVLVGSYVLVNLIVSVIIDTYNKEKARIGDGLVYLTPEQNAFLRSHRRLIRGVPLMFYDTKEVHPAIRWLRRAVASRTFNVITMVTVVLNAIFLALDYYRAPENLTITILAMNFFFSVCFVGEIIVKVVALGWHRFVGSRFNQIDLFVTVVCLIGVVLELNVARYTFIWRAMRVLSLFRVIRNAGRLRGIVNRFSLALYGLGNVATLISLWVFVFSFVGINVFGRVKFQENITRQANFSSLLRAMLVLLQAIAGGDWSGLMNDCAVEAPDCDPNINECGVNIFAQLFFVLFVAIVYFVLLNLFIAVVLDSFVATNYQTIEVSKEQVEQFFQHWFVYDPLETLRINSRDVVPMLSSLDASNPLGVGGQPSVIALRFIIDLELQEQGGMVELQDMIAALCRAVFGTTLPDSYLRKLQLQANRKFRPEERTLFYKKQGESFLVGERYAVFIIERAWQSFLARWGGGTSTCGGSSRRGTVIGAEAQSAALGAIAGSERSAATVDTASAVVSTSTVPRDEPVSALHESLGIRRAHNSGTEEKPQNEASLLNLPVLAFLRAARCDGDTMRRLDESAATRHTALDHARQSGTRRPEHLRSRQFSREGEHALVQRPPGAPAHASASYAARRLIDARVSHRENVAHMDADAAWRAARAPSLRERSASPHRESRLFASEAGSMFDDMLQRMVAQHHRDLGTGEVLPTTMVPVESNTTSVGQFAPPSPLDPPARGSSPPPALPASSPATASRVATMELRPILPPPKRLDYALL